MTKILKDVTVGELIGAIGNNPKVEVGKMGGVKVVVKLGGQEYRLTRNEIAKKVNDLGDMVHKKALIEAFADIESTVQRELGDKRSGKRFAHAIKSAFGKARFNFRDAMKKWPQPEKKLHEANAKNAPSSVEGENLFRLHMQTQLLALEMEYPLQEMNEFAEIDPDFLKTATKEDLEAFSGEELYQFALAAHSLPLDLNEPGLAENKYVYFLGKSANKGYPDALYLLAKDKDFPREIRERFFDRACKAKSPLALAISKEKEMKEWFLSGCPSE